MSPEEQMQKSSRRQLIVDSQVAIDYDQLQADRRDADISERQMQGCRTLTGIPTSGAGGFKWRVVPVSAEKNREARILLWLVGSAFLAFMVFIAVFLLFLN